MMRVLAVSTWIEVKLFLREPLTVVFTLALPLLFLFVLGGIFGNTPDPAVFRGAGPLDFYVPGYLALVWAAVGLLAFPVQIARYREDGVLRRFRASGSAPSCPQASDRPRRWAAAFPDPATRTASTTATRPAPRSGYRRQLARDTCRARQSPLIVHVFGRQVVVVITTHRAIDWGHVYERANLLVDTVIRSAGQATRERQVLRLGAGWGSHEQ
jgi:hypothetical protein